jgi:hypothetical protein
MAIASVLSPLSHYVAPKGGDAPPVALGELMDHVRGLVRDPRIPHVIGVCSPSGFTDEAKRAKLGVPNATVILIEPDGLGGWRTSATEDGVDDRVLKIFDPEGTKQKVERVRRVIEQSSAELLTGGLSVSAVAERSGQPQEVVRQAFTEVAGADPELRLTRHEKEFLLYRGAPVSSREKTSKSVIDRIRQLFSSEGDEVEKINLLAERRAALARRRDRIYEDISRLEQKEAQLLDEGKAAKSQVPRRRIAAQLAQLRKDIARQNTTAAMLNQQINIISTDIHNLTLIQQGQMARLPDTHELTENAVKAEEMLETLKADADLVGGLETGIEATLVSADEQAILKEFEEADRAKAPQKQPARAEDVPSAPEPLATRAPHPEREHPEPAGREAEPLEPDEPDERGRARRAEPS